MKKYSELLSKFLYFEKKHGRVHYKYHNIFVWRLLRANLYARLSDHLSKQVSVFKTNKKKWVRTLRDAIFYGRNLKRNNNSGNLRLILASSRYISNGDRFEDLFLQKEIELDDSIVVHTSQPDGSHLFYDSRRIILEDWYFFLYRSMYHILKRLNYIIPRELLDLETDFNEYFNVDFNVAKMIQNQLLLFNFDKKIFERLLKIVNPKEIVLTDHYSTPMALVSLANQKGIKVTEYQHGLIYEAHLGYNFPNQSLVPYYPDEIVLFGEYWKHQFHSPESTSIIVRHNEYYQSRIKGIRESKKKAKFDILAISNDSSFNENILNFAKSNSGKSIMLKLHPGSLGYIDDARTHYSKYNGSSNLTIIYNEYDLYDCIEQCSVAVGTNSTGIYEAISCGKKTYVLKPQLQPKVFTSLIEEGYLFGINELNEIKIETTQSNNKDYSIFFG